MLILASWWFIPLLIAVISRIWALGLVYLIGADSWMKEFLPAAGPATTWDGVWYLSIAQNGYHAAPLVHTIWGGSFHDFAFWPAWPALLAPIVHLLPASWIDLAAALTASTLTVAALVLWAKVLEPVFGRRAAWYTIAVVSFAPPAFALSLAYSEPLFLLVTAAFFLVSPGSPVRPLLAAFAQATRATGFALGASALPALWRSRGRDLRAWTILLAPLVVFAAWWLFVAQLTGDLTGFMLGTPSWGVTAWTGRGPASILIPLSLNPFFILPITIAFAFTALVIFGIVILFRRGLWDFAWYCTAAVLPTIAIGTWASMPRYALVAIPAIGAALAVIPARLRPWLVGACLVAEFFVAFLTLQGSFSP